MRPLLVDASAFTAACPNCPTAREVFEIVAESSIWPTLALLSLPLLVVAVVAAGLHRLT